MQREIMEFDVIIVGAGPAGLSAACRLMQLAEEKNHDLEVCVLEKGSEVGAHILSGAIFETRALDELFSDWKDEEAPLHTAVKQDQMFFLKNDQSSVELPHMLIPKSMHNDKNYIVSLGNLCRWLGNKAESLGVNIFPGFAVKEVIYGANNEVIGVSTGDMGRTENGSKKPSFEAGMELHAKHVMFAEGARGHLGKELIAKYQLDEDRDPQHYGLGIKELWTISPEKHQQGLVIHGSGWPLGKYGGGWFLYHLEDYQVAVGLIADLDYDNPYLSPFDEFQRLKHHPQLAQYLEGGSRVGYGARAISKGGINCLPKMSFPGGLLIGCDAGTLNYSKLKGSHTAMKSGMLGAEAIFKAFSEDPVRTGKVLTEYDDMFKNSWLYDELYETRNFGPALQKFGKIMGGAWNWIEQSIFKGKVPFTLHATYADYQTLKYTSESKPIDYRKPDGKLSFDKLSSVYLSNTNHEEDQPCHLILNDKTLPILQNLPKFDEPAQRYCPAGVYEVINEEGGEPTFVINAQNCIHCKTCDIKEPSQNIRWTVPEGGGGPNYLNM